MCLQISIFLYINDALFLLQQYCLLLMLQCTTTTTLLLQGYITYRLLIVQFQCNNLACI